MIEISFNGGDTRAIRAFSEVGPRIVTSLTEHINANLIRLQSHIITEKLEGQVLHHRSGKLIQSIRVNPVVQEGAQLEGSVQGGGGPAFYGRFHEFGLTSTHVRQSRHPRGTGTSVTRHFPERSFMRSSFEEMLPRIEEDLREAVAQALNRISEAL